MFTPEEIQAAIELRHELHRHPELRFREFRTAERIAGLLEQKGYEVTRGIAGTGVVALLETGRPGPVVALRADMDALPIVEVSDHDHVSQTPGVMHACGHDGHTAALMLAADALMRLRDQLCGTVKLIFQPAEEGGNGADKMIQEGVLENPSVDYIFGFHNRPGFDTGEVFVKSGSAMGGNDTFELILFGQSGHAAMPHLAVDPIYLGGSIIQQLQGVVARNKSPLHSGVITVSTFHAGDAANVIPASAQLTLNIRSDREASRQVLIQQMQATIEGLCSAAGATYTLTPIHQIPPLVNDAHWSQRVVEVAGQRRLGTRVRSLDEMPTMGAEDFAFYLQQVPGCFFFVGNGADSVYLHNDRYDFNDDILEVAASVHVAMVEDILAVTSEH
ncbi:M20 metallopeptidase family protein [Kushneria marisflavi]|uniref:Amidohydrolase n=1 Tax=Kushneria marisflavi TaxID=157779 RepID=A0A240UUE1_9GAMM|nr:amidohydrolase [Kushneria marisflavi]ART64630.1 amidohydrolase [Kushneria marisflavi]RKD84985.1 hippurate hydrolase [Kushneria marisflavi]